LIFRPLIHAAGDRSDREEGRSDLHFAFLIWLISSFLIKRGRASP